MKNIVSFVGHSDSGKTRLIERLVSILRRKGYRIGVLKHTHARIKVDRRGTDTDRLRRAGAAVSAIADDGTLVRFEDAGRPEETLARLASEVDLLLVEGYKKLPLPKVLIAEDDVLKDLNGIMAVVGNAGHSAGKRGIKRFKAGQTGQMARWLEEAFLKRGKGPRVGVSVDGRTLGMKPFVQETVAGVVAGLLRPLKGGRGRKAALSIDFGRKI